MLLLKIVVFSALLVDLLVEVIDGLLILFDFSLLLEQQLSESLIISYRF